MAQPKIVFETLGSSFMRCLLRKGHTGQHSQLAENPERAALSVCMRDTGEVRRYQKSMMRWILSSTLFAKSPPIGSDHVPRPGGARSTYIRKSHDRSHEHTSYARLYDIAHVHFQAMGGPDCLRVDLRTNCRSTLVINRKTFGR